MARIYYTQKELDLFKENLDIIFVGKKIKTRLVQECVHSGDEISPGSKAYFMKVFPNDGLGRFLELEKPTNFYACGTCMDCTH